MVSAPKYPDPQETAAAQSGMNRDTAITQMQLNSGTQINPWGTTSTSQTGSQGFTDSQGKWVQTPTFTTTQTLTPEQQAIFDKTQAAQGNLAGIAQEQSGKLGEYLNDPFTFNNHDAENWAYDLASQRILPQQQQNETDLRTKLINSGLRPGMPGWNSEMQRLTNANTDQMNQLALTGRSQGFQEAVAQRNQPLNELIGLMSGTQVQSPASQNAQAPSANVAGVDYTSLVNNKYQADLANSNAMNGAFGGLFGLGMKMLPFSDRRLKTDIKRVGTLFNGMSVYSYRLKGGPVQIGVMADEVLDVIPEAAQMDADGFYHVDYALATEASHGVI